MVGRNGDGANFLLFAGVFADFVLGQRGASQQLVAPLPAGDGVGDQNQSGALRVYHGRCTDDCLACATGQHHDAGAAFAEGISRHALVVAQFPGVVASGALILPSDGVCLTVDVSGGVIGRPADFQQLLFDSASLGGVHGPGVGIDLLAEHRTNLFVLGHLGQYRRVV